MKNDNNRWVDLSNGVAWAIIFSLAAIIMSICALAHKCPRIYGKGNLGFDYLGVIVGILALLVTFLVAWQIWQTMASKEELRRVERIGKKYDDLTKQVEMLKEIPEGFLYHTLAMSHFDKQDYTWAFIHLGWAVERLIKGQADYVRHIAHNIDLMDACLINLVNGHGDVAFFLNNEKWIDKAVDNLTIGITNLGKWTFDAQQKVNSIKGWVAQIRRNAEEQSRQTSDSKNDEPPSS